MSDTMISIQGLYKIFGRDPDGALGLVRNGVGKSELLTEHGHILGLNDINIEMPRGKLQVIMGLSGSGKSTLIRHINRLIEPTTGKVTVDGEEVLDLNQTQLRDFRRHQMSMVFQKFALLPHRTVMQNAAYGLELMGVQEEETHRRAAKWLDRVGLSGFESKYPSQLSGGMQQRVGLARALATDAPILLMDEAFSALDPLIRNDMQGVLLDLQTELHKTIVFITHDLEEALRIGDNIAILRDGKMVQSGTAQEIVLNPADTYVSDFTQEINRGRVLRVGTLMNAISVDSSLRLDEEMILEEALPKFAGSRSRKAAVTRDGKVIGSVSLDSMLTAISRPESGVQTIYN